MPLVQHFFEWQNRRAPLEFHDPDLMALREQVVDVNAYGDQAPEQLDDIWHQYAEAGTNAVVDAEERTLLETMKRMDTERLLRGYLYGVRDAIRVRKMHSSFSSEPPVTLRKIYGWLDESAQREHGRKLTFAERTAPLVVPVASFMVRKALLTDVRAERTKLNFTSVSNPGHTHFRHSA